MQMEEIEHEISGEEVRKAISQLGHDKVSSPNGFSILFYSTFWDIVGVDFLYLVKELCSETAQLDKINYS